MRQKKVKQLVEGEGKRKSGVVMGIDAHKSVLSCCILDQTEVLLEQNFSNNKTGIQKIMSDIKKFKVVITAFESTSVYHFKLMFTLLEEGHPILLANPLQTRTTQGKKTDKLDAHRIAVAHRDGRLKPSVIPTKSLMHLRRSLRTMLRLIADQTKSKQRLNQLFHQYDFLLHKTEKSLLTSKWLLQLFHDCLSLNGTDNPNKMIQQLINQHYPHTTKINPLRNQILLEELESLIMQLQDMPLDRYALLTELTQIRLFDILADQQRQVYLQYANENPDFAWQMKLLLTIPGIGPDSAAILLSEIVDINYFSTPNKLAKWAGLAPKVYQSGHRKRVTSKLHKGGNKHVRRNITLVCKGIYVRGDPSNPIYNFIKDKYMEKGAYWLAICAGSRKLLGIIWTVLKKEAQWSPTPVIAGDALVPLQNFVKSKIQAHERGIRKLQETQEKLVSALNHHLNLNWGGVKEPKKALKILLNAL